MSVLARFIELKAIHALLIALFTLAAFGGYSSACSQDFEEEFEDDFFEEEIDWEFIDALDSLDGINESEILDDFDIELDRNGLESALNEWVIIADPAEFPAIRSIGMTIDRIEPLEGLGLAVARIQTQGNLNLAQTQSAISAVAPSAEIDLNHVYRPSQKTTKRSAGPSPKSLVKLPAGFTGKGRKIGIIDTAINLRHPAFETIKIEVADFVSRKFERPEDHGTAVLSILAGASAAYTGLLPEADYYAASVFFKTDDGGRMATTDSLVRAISWMKENNVSVINMSLSGPPNRVLKRAIDAAVTKKTVVIAAVGNEGPNAPPLYPAAYTDVIGVTAVSERKKVYRLAGRGEHVDFAAPGVKVNHAAKSKSYKTSSGTSMATPFVTAIIVSSSTPNDLFSDELIEKLKSTAEDLGAKGFDPVYGYGLIKSAASPPK